jgi:hypothetical protein
MERVQQLIEVALTTPSKPKDCNCGCGKCKKSPLLKESKVAHLLSEGLTYHIENKIPLHECEYRIGSESHLQLIRESRKLYTRGVIEVSDMDRQLLETDLGHFGEYEGELVPLDLPMLNEISVNNFISDDSIRKLSSMVKDSEDVAQVLLDIFNKIEREKGSDVDLKSDRDLKVAIQSLIDAAVTPMGSISEPDTDTDSFKRSSTHIDDLRESELEEAEYQGKEVQLNKPKRGGSKAYYVYVRDPKTKKVKKVSFGSGGLKAKLSNKEARKNFASRHNCDQKKDRTKAGYWSCNLPRYAKSLGMGANMNTYW